MISFSELVCAVSTMRTAQKQYFRTKDKKDLYHAWNMERAVDQMLEQCFAPIQQSSPGSANETTPSPAGLNSQTAQPQPQDQLFEEQSKEPF